MSSGAIAAGLPALGHDDRVPPTSARCRRSPRSGSRCCMERLGAILGRARPRSPARCCSRPHDFGMRTQYLHARETLRRLLDLGVVPVVNENDTVADDEIRYGDNDRLAALVSHLVARRPARAAHRHRRACSPPIPASTPRRRSSRRSSRSTPRSRRSPAAPGTERGSGGMATKLAAAKIAAWSGVRAVIAAADAPGVVRRRHRRAARRHGRSRPGRERLSSRKLWIAFARGAAGRVVVDDGARRRARASSTGRCCPAGVRDVEGAFDADDAVEIVDGSTASRSRKGWSGTPQRCCAGSPAVGPPSSPTGSPHEVVHRDDLVGPPDAESSPDRDFVRTRPCATGLASVTLLPHELVVGRRGESPLRGLRQSARSGRKVRPGRPGRSARSGKRGWRATRPHPSRIRLLLRRASSAAGRIANRRNGGRLAGSGVHSRACPRPRPSPSSGGGRRRRRPALASAVDRREGRRPPRRRRPARASAPPTCSRRTRVDLEAAEAAGIEPGPLDRLRLTDGPHRGHGRRPAPGRRAARPGRRGARRLAPPQRAARSSAVRVPLGVVAIIYENRPNVTSDAAGICLKSGNAALLRGSATRAALEPGHRRACCATGSPRPGSPPTRCCSSTTFATRPRSSSCSSPTYVDCLIPRGGPALIQSIRDHATVPVIIDGDGNCHVYVDAAADLDGALDIVVNAKTQRPSVCNAAESLVVHEAVADAFLPAVATALVDAGRRAGRRRRRAGPRARHGRGDRRRLRPRVPRAQDERRGGAVARRRHRPREPVRLRPHRGDPHPRPRCGRAASPTRSTPARSW